MASFDADYRRLAEEIDVDCGALNDTAMRNAVRKWLQRNNNWLMVVDNADRREDFDGEGMLRTALPRCKARSAMIIYTSRSESVAELLTDEPSRVLKVDNLTENDSVELLRSKLGQTNNHDTSISNEDALELLHAVEYLPLSISHAAAVIRKTRISIQEYLRRLASDEGLLDLLNRDKRDVLISRRHETAPTSVVKVWWLTFNLLGQEKARVLFFAMVCLDRHSISVDSLATLISGFRPGSEGSILANIFELLKQPTELDFALVELESLALITPTSDDRSFTIHRLDQAIAIQWLQEETYPGLQVYTRILLACLRAPFERLVDEPDLKDEQLGRKANFIMPIRYDRRLIPSAFRISMLSRLCQESDTKPAMMRLAKEVTLTEMLAIYLLEAGELSEADKWLNSISCRLKNLAPIILQRYEPILRKMKFQTDTLHIWAKTLLGSVAKAVDIARNLSSERNVEVIDDDLLASTTLGALFQGHRYNELHMFVKTRIDQLSNRPMQGVAKAYLAISMIKLHLQLYDRKDAKTWLREAEKDIFSEEGDFPHLWSGTLAYGYYHVGEPTKAESLARNAVTALQHLSLTSDMCLRTCANSLYILLEIYGKNLESSTIEQFRDIETQLQVMLDHKIATNPNSTAEHHWNLRMGNGIAEAMIRGAQKLAWRPKGSVIPHEVVLDVVQADEVLFEAENLLLSILGALDAILQNFNYLTLSTMKMLFDLMLHTGALEDVHTFAKIRASFLADVIMRRGIANLDDHPNWIEVDKLFSSRKFLHPAYVKILGTLFLQHKKIYHHPANVPNICPGEFDMACDHDERSSCAREHSDEMPSICLRDSICLQECRMARYVWSKLEYMQNGVFYTGYIYNDFSLYRGDVEWARPASCDTTRSCTPTLSDAAETDALHNDVSSVHERRHEEHDDLGHCASEPDLAPWTVPRSVVFRSRSNTI